MRLLPFSMQIVLALPFLWIKPPRMRHLYQNRQTIQKNLSKKEQTIKSNIIHQHLIIKMDWLYLRFFIENLKSLRIIWINLNRIVNYQVDLIKITLQNIKLKTLSGFLISLINRYLTKYWWITVVRNIKTMQ